MSNKFIAMNTKSEVEQVFDLIREMNMEIPIVLHFDKLRDKATPVDVRVSSFLTATDATVKWDNGLNVICICSDKVIVTAPVSMVPVSNSAFPPGMDNEEIGVTAALKFHDDFDVLIADIGAIVPNVKPEGGFILCGLNNGPVNVLIYATEKEEDNKNLLFSENREASKDCENKE